MQFTHNKVIVVTSHGILSMLYEYDVTKLVANKTLLLNQSCLRTNGIIICLAPVFDHMHGFVDCSCIPKQLKTAWWQGL